MEIVTFSMFEFCCIPRQDFPIRSCTVIIYAKDKEEAKKILMENEHKFFDQDMNVIERVVAHGYGQFGA